MENCFLLGIVAVLIFNGPGIHKIGCHGRRLSPGSVNTVMRQIDEEFDCNQLKGKFHDNSPEMLLICQNIMNSELIRRTKEYMHNITKARENTAANAFGKSQKSLTRKKRAFDSGCPTFTEEYLRKYKDDIGRRSLSPYVSEISYDTNRFPTMILESKCACKGCIDPTTGRQTFTYSSVPVEVEQSVFYKSEVDGSYTIATRKFKVACTCVAHPLLFVAST